MWKLFIFTITFLVYGCAGELDKCVKAEMDKFYAERKSGRHLMDIIYNEDGTVFKKKKRSPKDHEKMMRNDCLKKRFEKD